MAEQPRANTKRDIVELSGFEVATSPRKSTLPNWTGEDVFVIGGGPSLKTFDWNRLIGCNTIGCNQAFFLGADICNICTFGDKRFWDSFRSALDLFGGWVVTNYRISNPPNWLNVFTRQDEGVSPPGECLAWNGNTGAMSIDLALKLGAKRVLLLGFDLGSPGPMRHWHDKALENSPDEVYRRFGDCFRYQAMCIRATYADREVINLSDGSSVLQSFRILDRDGFFGSLK